MITLRRGAQIGVSRALAAAIFLAFIGCQRDDFEAEARNRLAQALRDSLGAGSNPSVGFLVDGGKRHSHLYIMFDTAAVMDASDSLFASRALDIARFSLRHYDKATRLDSITIATRKLMERSVWRAQHTRTVAVDQARVLADGASTVTPTNTR